MAPAPSIVTPNPRRLAGVALYAGRIVCGVEYPDLLAWLEAAEAAAFGQFAGDAGFLPVMVLNSTQLR